MYFLQLKVIYLALIELLVSYTTMWPRFEQQHASGRGRALISGRAPNRGVCSRCHYDQHQASTLLAVSLVRDTTHPSLHHQPQTNFAGTTRSLARSLKVQYTMLSPKRAGALIMTGAPGLFTGHLLHIYTQSPHLSSRYWCRSQCAPSLFLTSPTALQPPSCK